MFSIAMLQLYVFKNMKAFKGKKGSHIQELKDQCKSMGGDWHEDSHCCEFGDPGEREPFPNNMRCEFTEAAKTRMGCPVGCKDDPHSSYCVNNPACVFPV